VIVDDPRLSRLWVAAHRRLERTGGRTEGASVRIDRPSDDERAALDRLLGRRSRGRDVTVRLDDVDAVLRRVDTTLLDTVCSKVGEVRDLPAVRARAEAAEEALWSSLYSHLALQRHPALSGWFENLRASGHWRRLDDPGLRLRQALDVVGHLPHRPPVTRKRLAADVLGHAHALDDAAPVGRLVTRALARLASGEAAAGASGRRALWAGMGVLIDDTSSTVLTTGLRPVAAGPVTEAAARWADAGVPLVVALAAVEAEWWQMAPGTRLWVCENPEVLAAAGDLGVPLICVEGWPSRAAEGLMASLQRGGARLAYHGDFGSGGVAIANAVIGGLGAEPWRMSHRDHAAALEHAGAVGVDLPPLRGSVPEAVWDPDLAPAITACGVEIEEELVLELLLNDLRHHSH
jgi:uncharacterized protein (TIGR02679 family)